ncbi:hypothetical protein Ndes2526B_g00701 [Nannochloris sp. 'desiccata']|nr:hypothetical protein KSW81_003999 [Chlorella desiccata (nom. nud.)]KAH7624502.1 hypothetical protein NADE_003854 [Chlorella desiccata (nom. nud.)]
MEGPTLQQDAALVLGFLTSVITVTGLWAIFTPPLANAYQKMAKNIYSLLPDIGVVDEDNGHDTSRTILPLTKKTSTTTPGAAVNTAASEDIKRTKIVSAINGPSSATTPPPPKTTTTTSPGNGTVTASSSVTQGRPSPASTSTLANGNSSGTQIRHFRRKSSTSTAVAARTSPKPPGQPATSA